MPTHEKDHHSQNVNDKPKKGKIALLFMIL